MNWFRLVSRFFLLFLLCAFSSFCISQSISSQASRHAWLVQVDTSVNWRDELPKEIKVGAVMGDIVSITSNNDFDINEIPGICHVQKARPIKPDLYRAVPDVRADLVHKGIELETGYSGKDVIIGVTDWGFDYSHPMFYDTLYQNSRIIAAWDQFRNAGPAPNDYDYGTLIEGEENLIQMGTDTFGVYEYATHGTHVSGIAGGSGGKTEHRGVAYEAEFLFVSFLVDEAAVLDGIKWMQSVAKKQNKPLVINMSWGLYHIGTLDGNSLLSKALDELSRQGVIFVSSGGNNGADEFHIQHTFANDTIRSGISFFPYDANPNTYGQGIIAWGEQNRNFSVRLEIYDGLNKVSETSWHSTSENLQSSEKQIIIGSDTVFYITQFEDSSEENGLPHMRWRIKKKNSKLNIVLNATAMDGSVHFWNVTDLTNEVGNWGMPFIATRSGWLSGDSEYGIGEPASTASVITVAAHSAEIVLGNGQTVRGERATFSSIGPLYNGQMKPNISAPGVSVISSISSYTTQNYTAIEAVDFKDRTYPFAAFSGTSMSSPAVTGVVALMLDAHPKLNASEIKQILQKTARIDKNTGTIPDGGSPFWGYGKVDAHAAVKEAEQRWKNRPADIDESIVFFPNPAEDYLEIHQPIEGETVQIYSIAGQLIIETTITEKSNRINLTGMVPGTYLLKFENRDTSVQRLLIMRY